MTYFDLPFFVFRATEEERARIASAVSLAAAQAQNAGNPQLREQLAAFAAAIRSAQAWVADEAGKS